MLLAADYPFLDVMWTMLVFFAWVIWFWILISILADIFRRHDISGWVKAAWTVFLIVLPFLGVLIYLIANGKGMAERNVERAQAAGAIGGPSAEIATAKELLDKGAITQEEFEAIKRKALASA
ncbi:MAG TPA: SHOCT domain-containing protein [Gaiellaceae bacterium]|nr:SHOCT domain-containing protein [Gaiellaceae bacterium]